MLKIEKEKESGKLESESEKRNNYHQLSCAYKSTATWPLSTHSGEAVMAPYIWREEKKHIL